MRVSTTTKNCQVLGDEFVEEFERQILRVASSAKQWSVIQQGIRRALLRRFPYVIYYKYVEADRIRITVVKHQRRHPSYGIDRA
jgi:toxin ParE1/3/4